MMLYISNLIIIWISVVVLFLITTPLNIVDEKGKFDELIEEKGVKILIDPKALMHVIGTKMDFVDDKLR